MLQESHELHQDIGFFLGWWLPPRVNAFLQSQGIGIWQLLGALSAHFHLDTSLATGHLELLWRVIGRHWALSADHARGLSAFLNALRQGLEKKVKGTLPRKRLVRAIKNRFRRAAQAAETWLGLPGSLGARLTESMLIRLRKLAPELQARMHAALDGIGGPIHEDRFHALLDSLLPKESPPAAPAADPGASAPTGSEPLMLEHQFVQDGISAIVAWFLSRGLHVRVRVELLNESVEPAPHVEPLQVPQGSRGPRAEKGLWERLCASLSGVLLPVPSFVPESGLLESAFQHKEDTS